MERYLKPDANGRMVFSPDAGAGYFLPDKATQERVICLLNRVVWLYAVLLLAPVVKIISFVHLVAIFPLFLLWYAAAPEPRRRERD